MMSIYRCSDPERALSARPDHFRSGKDAASDAVIAAKGRIYKQKATAWRRGGAGAVRCANKGKESQEVKENEGPLGMGLSPCP